MIKNVFIWLLTIIFMMFITCISLAHARGSNIKDYLTGDVKVYDNIESHAVAIFSLGGLGISKCSGIVVKEDKTNTYILTAKHCVAPTEEVYVENKLVDLIISPINDDISMMIIKGKIKDKTPVKFASKNSEIGEVVYHVSYPKFTGRYAIKGEILKYTEDWVFVAFKTIGGCSGGGVYNKNAELVGILWGGFTFEPVSIFESLEDIKSFLNKIDIID